MIKRILKETMKINQTVKKIIKNMLSIVMHATALQDKWYKSSLQNRMINRSTVNNQAFVNIAKRQ